MNMKFEIISTYVDEEFKRMTGISKDVFNIIATKIKNIYEKREFKCGKKRLISLEDQFLLVLCYYLESTSHFKLSKRFNISETSVGRYIDSIERILTQIPEFKELNKTLLIKNENLDTIIVDNTEIPIYKPKKNKRATILAKVNGML